MIATGPIPGWAVSHAASWLAATGPSRLMTPMTLEPAPVSRAADAVVQAARLSPAQAGVLMVCSLLISAAILAWGFWWWRAKNEPARERAFRILAVHMRLCPKERDIVRRAAAGQGVPPCGLLVSVSALRAALHHESLDVDLRDSLLARCV